MPEKLQSVQEHAAQIMKGLVQDGTVGPDPQGAGAAAAVPVFSTGTLPVDQNTGQPITGANAPAFATAQVELPKDTETTGNAATPLPERDEQGRFVGENPPEQTALERAGIQAPKEEQQTQAAEQAAAQILDNDEETWEFEDPDLKVKIPLKYPKKYATQIKRGYPRMADYSRLRNMLGEVEPTLRPLIENGQMRQILPLLQYALNNEAYGNYVFAGYQRAQQGLPLIERAVQQAAQMQQQPVPQQEVPFQDPLLDAALNPLLNKISAFEQRFQTFEQQREEEQRRTQALQATQMQQANEMMAAHRDLETMYPGTFNTALGPNDPAWVKAQQMAQASGYTTIYGLRGGIVFGGQQWQAQEAERLALTASPAAEALNTVDQRRMELARQQAAASAKPVGGGTNAAVPPTPPKPPERFDKNGVLKPAAQFLQEVAAYTQMAQTA